MLWHGRKLWIQEGFLRSQHGSGRRFVQSAPRSRGRRWQTNTGCHGHVVPGATPCRTSAQSLSSNGAASIHRQLLCRANVRRTISDTESRNRENRSLILTDSGSKRIELASGLDRHVSQASRYRARRVLGCRAEYRNLFASYSSRGARYAHGCGDLSRRLQDRRADTTRSQIGLFVVDGVSALPDLRELLAQLRDILDGMRREALERQASKEVLLFLFRDKRHHRLSQRRAVHRTPNSNLRHESKRVTALHDVQVKDLAAIQNRKVHCFAGCAPELLHDRTADLAQRRLV